VTTDQEEIDEDREAQTLEFRWRQGIAAMVIGFLVVLGLFWGGVYLFTPVTTPPAKFLH
jgi:hypothetical protein